MSILDVLGYQRRPTKADVKRYPAWVHGSAKAEAWGEHGEAPSYIKAAERYTNSDLVYMCVKRLGDMAADSQLVLYRSDGERDPQTGMPLDDARLEPSEHPFYELWNKPNFWDSKAEFLESLAITLLISPKGVFVHLDDGERAKQAGRIKRIELNKEPMAMWWLLPEAIDVIPSAETWIGSYLHEIAGEKTEFQTEAIMRIVEFNPLNRYLSLSRVQPANLASMSDIDAQRANQVLFKNGFKPSAIIETDREYVDPEELKLIEELWQKRMTGVENWHKLFPLWSGFKLKEYGQKLNEIEFNESAKTNRFRVFGVFGVHPAVVLSEDVNLANAKIGEKVTRSFTLKPLLRRISDEVTDILPLWDDAPAAEAHFINVVPEDDELAADIQRIKAETANKNVSTIAELINVFGSNGLEIAKEMELIPANVEMPEAIEGIEAQFNRRYWNGVKQTGTIVPVLPEVPLGPVRISEADIDRALAEFYGVFPELTGILEAGSNGRS